MKKNKKNKKIKTKRRIPNWNLIRNKMVCIVERVLRKKWNVPVVLEIYEFSKNLPIKNDKNFEGFVSFFSIHNDLYIDYIALRKNRSKEFKTFIIAHELGHILDALEYGLEGNMGADSAYNLLDDQGKRILWEGEKRAFVNGYELLEFVKTPNYYLERFIKNRSKSLSYIFVQFQNKKKIRKHF